MPKLSLIAAALPNNGIGKQNTLPWSVPTDMKFFNLITTYLGRRTGSAYPTSPKSDGTLGPMNIVIMGRKSWESIPDKYQPFKGRINIVLSRNEGFRKTLEERFRKSSSISPSSPVYTFPNLDSALSTIQESISHSNVFITGGGELYKESITHPSCDRVFLTRLEPAGPDTPTPDCDTFFPDVPRDMFDLVPEDKFLEIVGPQCRVGKCGPENGLTFEFQLFQRREA
ncbi:dihydrofolate reductase-like domain-containing protein [Phlyctochytrium arcticum]|nr:dihydrofolate reductase-like domain-containing protein [Phlyctochytrium arcticum]